LRTYVPMQFHDSQERVSSVLHGRYLVKRSVKAMVKTNDSTWFQEDFGGIKGRLKRDSLTRTLTNL
jgi:hypothetical protein